MTGRDANLDSPLGFLTVVDRQPHGLFGGYLLLNRSGRPLEFHCTTPIKPNRAQEILYGPTLEAFLYGEQIGQTLLEKAKIEPNLVCTDREPVLAVREHVSLPMVLVLSEECPTAGQGGQLDPPDVPPPGGHDLRTFRAGRYHLAVPGQFDGDREKIIQRLARLPGSFDLAEPFTRICQAIEEAQRAVRSASRPAA